MHLIARWKTPGEIGHVPLALEKKESGGSIQFTFGSCIFLCGRLLYTLPYLLMYLSFIHSLLNTGDVPGTLLGYGRCEDE